jgi:primary-amine oxidase
MTPAERYAAGDYINQNPEPNGIEQWIERDRSLENAGLVVWHTVGVHHLARPKNGR